MDINILLGFGCLFPAISWLSFIVSYISEKITGKYSSAIIMPVIGPIFINLWSLGTSQPLWTLILPWVLDIGTLSFFSVLPGMIKESWKFSKFTELITVVSNLGCQTVKLSLQKNNIYIIRYSWSRNEGQCGIVATNDFGSFEQINDKFILKSHTGTARIFEKINNEYHCLDLEAEGDYNLNGYVFT